MCGELNKLIQHQLSVKLTDSSPRIYCCILEHIIQFYQLLSDNKLDEAKIILSFRIDYLKNVSHSLINNLSSLFSYLKSNNELIGISRESLFDHNRQLSGYI